MIHDPQQLNRNNINQTTTKHQQQKPTKAKCRRYLKVNRTYIHIDSNRVGEELTHFLF